jgi:hypothetical protein
VRIFYAGEKTLRIHRNSYYKRLETEYCRFCRWDVGDGEKGSLVLRETDDGHSSNRGFEDARNMSSTS